MSICLSQVYEYLAAHPVSNYSGDLSTLLGMLHYIYVTGNPVDNDRIRKALEQFENLTKKLTMNEADELFGAVSDLCWEHESLAFSHGLLAGMVLMTELNALP